ncbi:MAG: hypothetical protein AAGB30_10985 [Pedobacter sp.]
MIRQYPDIIFYPSYEGESEYDQASGTWVTSGGPGTSSIGCRAELNSKGEMVLSNDGTELAYTFIVYLPAGSPGFEFGQEVYVVDQSGSKFTGTVKLFKRGQLNARLWL